MTLTLAFATLTLVLALAGDKHKPIAYCELQHVSEYGDAWLVRCRTPKRYVYADRAGKSREEAEAIAKQWLIEHAADWEVIDVQRLMQERKTTK